MAICRQLDGIPLALELAAARLRAMSPELLLERLDQRFRLLTGGSRTALPRQQTLRALIDWSYQLLNPAERAVFRRLAVFAGGWTLEAAEVVCAAEEVASWEVLDHLTALVDKSLIMMETDRDGHIRYRFLETVREFALHELDASGERDRLRQRAAHYYLKIACAKQRELEGLAPPVSEDLAAFEVDNIRAAFATFLAFGEKDAAVMLLKRYKYLNPLHGGWDNAELSTGIAQT